MALQFTYADDSPVREGDFVRIQHGSAIGRVSEVIDTPRRAAEMKLEGLGIVVDAQPKGFVFLSEALLSEDPLHYVRRGPSEQIRVAAAITVGLSLLLLLPVLYSLASALYSALSTGEVLVISVGRYETSRELVPWRSGWARFAGPLILVVSLLASDDSRGATMRWWMAATGSATGLLLLGFSRWFTSVDGALSFLAFFAFLALALYFDKKFGHATAFVFIVTCVGLLVWKTVGPT